MLFQDKYLAITETSVTPHDGIVAILYSLLPKTTLNTWKLRKNMDTETLLLLDV